MFLDEIDRVAKIVKTLIKQKNVKIIAQYDADGITSASIIAKMLLRENVNFELRIVKQLTSDVIDNLDIDDKSFLILVDLGSGQVNRLDHILEKTQILILDHHEPIKFNHLNLFHINPLIFGEEESSSSIVCYLFAKSMNLDNIELVNLAIVGAIADMQDDKWEFTGVVKKILEEAVTIGKISVLKGLRLYGRNTRSIHQSLAYSFDPFIPGISGSESHAIQFLCDIGIEPKCGSDWRKLKDLTLEEQQKLASAILLERIGTEEDAEDIFGEIYSLLDMPEDLQDAREFATLLNACGRTDNSDVGIRLCLGDFTALENSWDVLGTYRKLLSDSLNWVRENPKCVTKTDFANYLIANNKIPEVIIGTMTSLMLKSDLTDMHKPLFGLADTDNGKVKISARISRSIKNINLRDVIVNSTKVVEGEGGGHMLSAGGLIPKGKEQKFIETVDSLLGEIIGSKKD